MTDVRMIHAICYHEDQGASASSVLSSRIGAMGTRLGRDMKGPSLFGRSPVIGVSVKREFTVQELQCHVSGRQESLQYQRFH